MHPLCNVLFILAIACFFVLPMSSLRAGTPMSDRVAVEAGVRTELAKDLALPPPALSDLSGRRCLDGRPVDGVQGEVVENAFLPFGVSKGEVVDGHHTLAIF